LGMEGDGGKGKRDPRLDGNREVWLLNLDDTDSLLMDPAGEDLIPRFDYCVYAAGFKALHTGLQ